MELGPDLWISLKEVLQALVLDQPGVELLRERLDCLVDLDVGVSQTNADLIKYWIRLISWSVPLARLWLQLVVIWSVRQ